MARFLLKIYNALFEEDKKMIIRKNNIMAPLTRPHGKMQQFFVIGFTSVALVACADLAGPAYQRPDLPSKTNWSQSGSGQPFTVDVIRPDWWTGFGDSYLNGLVQQAIADNSDLRVQVARIKKAEAEWGGAEGQRLPKLSLGGNTDIKTQNTPMPQRGGSTSYQPTTSQNYSVGGSLNWEIDIWGKTRKGVEAAEAGYKASEAEWRATYLTAVSEVATTYFQIRQLDEQIAQQQRTLVGNRQILAIYEAQLREGVASSNQVLSQKAEVNSLEKNLLDLQRQRKLAEHALATLLGKPAGTLTVPVAPLQNTVQPVSVPAGLPADLLERRPDLIAAEYRVLQTHKLTGQARLAKLPSISLSGNGGLASNALSGLLKGWSFGLAPSINLPLFDPSLETNVKIKEAETGEAAENYRRTVLMAFREVEDALTNLAYHKEQKQQLEAQANNLRTVQRQIQAQLKEGVISQLQVFETERNLLRAEQDLLAIHSQVLSDTVTLYKALGGGWPAEPIKLGKAQ